MMDTNKPIVSILILTYNRLPLSEVYIPKLLANIGSIPYEVLIWDNGSADGTYDWLCDYKLCDNRILEVVGSETNIGMEAINNLASISSGKYILKVDDDVDVPRNFAERLVRAYEQVNDPKLLFLGWDMFWGQNTFATRSGRKLYKDPQGRTVEIGHKEQVLIHFNPKNWMVNGVCRLSPKNKFLEIGGHPKGIIYGVDSIVSEAAAKYGYYIGYMHAHDLVKHCGSRDSQEYRRLKTRELKKANAPLHV